MKKYLIKTLSLLLLVIAVISLNACKETAKYNTTVPYGTLSDTTTYATMNNETISQKKLYDVMRKNGYTYLMDEISNILIKPETSVTESNKPELIKIVNKKCFGTEDIEDLDLKTKEQKIEKYVDQMALVNVTITKDDIYTDECLAYYLPALAQKKYAKSLITNENSKYYYKNEYQKIDNKELKDDNGKKITNPYYIDDEKIEDTYNSSYEDELTTEVIIIGFNTVKEAEDALNTSETHNESTFTNIYKEEYSFKETNFELTSEDLSKYPSGLQTLISNLKDNEYTIVPQQFDAISYIVYMIKQKDLPDYSEASQDTKDQIVTDLIDGFVTDSFVSSEVTTLINESTIEIYDPVFAQQYMINNDEFEPLTINNWKNEYNQYVAKVNDSYVTVDAFYKTLESQIGITSTMDYFTNKYLLTSDDASKLTDTDIKNINKNYTDTIKKFKNNELKNSGYPSTLSEDVFKFLYYGSSDKTENINYLKAQKTWDYVIKDYPDNYLEILTKFSENYAKNYFDLAVKHILLYVDYDMDGTPDNPDTFKAKLSEADQQIFDQAIVSLMDAIVKEANYLVEQDYSTLNEALNYILKSYYANETILSNPSKTWKDYKKFNISLKIEDLSNVNSSNASKYVTEFGVGVNKLYNELKAAEKLNEDYLAEKVESIDELIKTVYGYHILSVYDTKEMTSASYLESKDTSKVYQNIKVTWNGTEETLNAYNEKDYASLNQIKIYVAQVDTSDGVTGLPSDVKTYISNFYSSFKTRYTDETFQNILLAKKNLNINFASTENNNKYQEFLEIQIRQFDDYTDYSETSSQTFAGWWDLFLK